MAIGSIPPWLNVGPKDFITAAQEGASAGSQVAQTGAATGLRAAELSQQSDITSAKLRQEAELEGQRLAHQSAMEAQRLAMEGARLQQQGQLAQMELEAKKEQTAQQAARMAQEHEMEFAYRQAQIGLASGRLQTTQQAAEEKSRQAASIYADSVGFATYLKDHPDDVMGALALYPNASQKVTTTARMNKPEAEKVFHYQGEISRVNPRTGEVTTLQESRAPTPEERVVELQIRQAIKDKDPVTVAALTRQLQALQEAKRIKTTGTGTAGWTMPDWMTNPAQVPTQMPGAEELPPSEAMPIPAATESGTAAKKPTRKLASDYVRQYGKAEALKRLEAEGYDVSGYAD